MTDHSTPPYPGLPLHAAQPINLRDMGVILQIMIKDAAIRAAMFKDPAATLTSLNYAPGPGVIAFFQTLSEENFSAAAAQFKPAHPDPQFGMAEY
jgi:hypothetical protein